jgi:hypothetical protein
MQDWDSLLQTASALIISKENYQKKLGELSWDVIKSGGRESLPTFAKEIEDMTGHRVSPTTLRNYAWVWMKTKELEIPEDIPFSVCQLIAGTPNPLEYANKIKEGASGAEIARLIKGERPGKIIVCPLCGGQFNEKEKK